MTRKCSGKEQKTAYNQYVTKLPPGYQTVTFRTICTPPPITADLTEFFSIKQPNLAERFEPLRQHKGTTIEGYDCNPILRI